MNKGTSLKNVTLYPELGLYKPFLKFKKIAPMWDEVSKCNLTFLFSVGYEIIRRPKYGIPIEVMLDWPGRDLFYEMLIGESVIYVDSIESCK